jgi:hypothetical protein
MKKMILFIGMLFVPGIMAVQGQPVEGIRHHIAAIQKDRFLGWPANNGLWQWGDEILVGFTMGEYGVSGGHNITGIEESLFSRSLDGGVTWKFFDPDDFLDDENIKWLPKGKRHLEAPLNFRHKGFTMRIFATGYHGNDDPEGGFYYSYDRGATWEGPYFLGNIFEFLKQNEEITALTPRTDYIITGQKELYIFITASNGIANRVGCIKTADGGLSFEFVSWITPREYDRYIQPIMSSTVQISDDIFITAYRKIYPALKNRQGNAIEVAISEDRCHTWKTVGTVKTFESSSNPPALLKLNDGRLLCVYGDRHNSRMAGRYSEDEGKTWGTEFIIRDNFTDGSSYWDFGYPVVLQRDDGKLVAIYYWADVENPQQHIAVSIWDLPEKNGSGQQKVD